MPCLARGPVIYWFHIMKSILVVDDDKIVLEDICSHLSGYRTYQAASGRAALESARLNQPDLILLDIDMPGMDGFFVLDQLRQHHQCMRIPVVFLTNDASAEIMVRGLKSGVVDFIVKPLGCSMDWEILRHRIELHLKLGAYRISLEHSADELEENIGLCFSELLEYKDYNFSGHVMRTERYAEFLSLALYNAGVFSGELSLNAIDDLKRAVIFHDIGKIGISDEILCKQGRLTGEEMQTARAHTIIGEKILNTIHDRIPNRTYFKTAGIIARGHHERFDGRGYPDGLSGKDIPLCCRIVSVVNVYDACVSERVYHPAMDHADACAEIEKGRGGEFDPKIVDVFLRYHREFAGLGEELKTAVQHMGTPPAFMVPVAIYR